MIKSPEHGTVGTDSNVELLLSNLDLPPFDIARGGVSLYNDRIGTINAGSNEPGYDGGYEITPTRALSLSMATQVDRLTGPQHDQPFATALHQSWAAGPLTIAGSLREQPLAETAFDAAAYVTILEQRRSLKTLRWMNNSLGGVPFIVYPEDARVNDPHVQPMEDRSTQIMPENYNQCGGDTSYRTFHNYLGQRLIHGIVIDPHHLLRAAIPDENYRLDVDTIMDDMAKTGTLVTRIHAAAGRVDTKHHVDRKRSMVELKAMLTSPEAIGRTAMGAVMGQAYELWQEQRRDGMPIERILERADNLHASVLAAEKQDSREDSTCSVVTRSLRINAGTPVEQQFREESEYRERFTARTPKLPVTIEVPYGGLQALRREQNGAKVKLPDFTSMHRDMIGNLRGFFTSLDT